MAVGVNRERGGLWTLMILYPATSMHNHSVSDCSGDRSTKAVIPAKGLLWDDDEILVLIGLAAK